MCIGYLVDGETCTTPGQPEIDCLSGYCGVDGKCGKAPSSGPQRRRARRAEQRLLAARDDRCPKPLSACPIGATGFECIDLSQELESCGRCGNDCTQIEGVDQVAVRFLRSLSTLQAADVLAVLQRSMRGPLVRGWLPAWRERLRCSGSSQARASSSLPLICPFRLSLFCTLCGLCKAARPWAGAGSDQTSFAELPLSPN